MQLTRHDRWSCSTVEEIGNSSFDGGDDELGMRCVVHQVHRVRDVCWRRASGNSQRIGYTLDKRGEVSKRQHRTATSSEPMTMDTGAAPR